MLDRAFNYLALHPVLATSVWLGLALIAGQIDTWILP